jgi:HK97 family phage prohead protease
MSIVRPVIVRTYRAEISDGDGRTLVGRVVPYGETATVADLPAGRRYRESFSAGSFKRNTRAPNRVLLDFEHGTTFGDKIGHATELVERDDGLHGVFRTAQAGNGPLALELVEAGVLTGFSVSAEVFRSTRRSDGVVMRTSCNLLAVALCREPAYDSARVEAIRVAPGVLDEADYAEHDLGALRPAPNVALDDRLRALGLLSATEQESDTLA